MTNLTTDLEAVMDALARATEGPWNVAAFYTNTGTPEERTWGQIVNNYDYGVGVIDEKEAPATQDSLSYDLDAIAHAVNFLRNYGDAIRDMQGALAEATREETCPMCEGHKMKAGEFCIAHCLDGKVRWTTANVLRPVKPWVDADAKRVRDMQGEIERKDAALRLAVDLDAALFLSAEYQPEKTVDEFFKTSNAVIAFRTFLHANQYNTAGLAALNPKGEAQ